MSCRLNYSPVSKGLYETHDILLLLGTVLPHHLEMYLVQLEDVLKNVMGILQVSGCVSFESAQADG